MNNDQSAKLNKIQEKYLHHSLCSDPIVWDETRFLLDIIREYEEVLGKKKAELLS